jgi:HAD superfamily hydrolase (TIGR01509 family)
MAEPDTRAEAGAPTRLEAVIFDTDGVIARTAEVHRAAWKALFDSYLSARAERDGGPFEPFTADDYRLYVDGKARHDGIEAFLASRGIAIDSGQPDDPPDRETLYGLGNRKNAHFLERLRQDGVRPYESTLELLRSLRAAGIRTAAVSASENCGEVLEAVGASDLVDARVDGLVATEMGLAGKPDPALFLEAARRLRVTPRRSAVVEDAIAGVEAGRRGGFGLVVGVDRTGHGADLIGNGADVVVPDLNWLSVGADGRWSIAPEAEAPEAQRPRSDDWYLGFEGPDSEGEGLREALCTLGNGFFATRGASPEHDHDEHHHPGTYVGGVYNRLISDVAGHKVENESLVNVPNWLPLTARADGGAWFGEEGTTLSGERHELDMFRGVLLRWARYEDADGRITRLTQRRFVSMRDRHLACLETTFVAENWSGTLEVRSALDGEVRNNGVPRYQGLDDQELDLVTTSEHEAGVVSLVAHTRQSRIRITEAAALRLTVDGDVVEAPFTTQHVGGRVSRQYEVPVRQGQEIVVEKTVALVTSRDDGISEPLADAVGLAVQSSGFEELLERHVIAWRHIWRQAHLELGTDGDIGRLLHLHIFHLLQTVSQNTIGRDVGVPARGLHGEAYRGHIFWDELFIFPYLSLRFPQLTRSLLLYRFRRLDAARLAARDEGLLGAMFPWQSGSNGREETQTLHLNPISGRWLPDASHLQRHVSAAVAVNVWQYYQASGDLEFLRAYGAEMILEIARFWASIATYNHELGRYEIKGVMGPDEYHEAYPGADTPGLDNNSYTNLMAVWCICRAFDTIDALPATSARELLERLGITMSELDRWGDVSRRMRLCFHDGVLSQFEGYERLEELDWDHYEQTYGDIRRLDRILESEGDSPNHYRLSKQPDVTMLFYVLSAPEIKALVERLGYDYDEELIPRNIEYYESRTAHGSSLSSVVDAWVHARLDRKRSWDLFVEALHSDVDDVQGGTTPEGIHLGAMAGTIDLLQRCYTGLETRDDVLRIEPVLPDELGSIAFDVRYRGHLVLLEVTLEFVRVCVDPDEGAPITVEIHGARHDLHPGHTLEVKHPH